jgi:hypothetical protein
MKERKKQGEGRTLRSRVGKELDNFMAECKQKKERVEQFKSEKGAMKKQREEREDLKEGSKHAASQFVLRDPRPHL